MSRLSRLALDAFTIISSFFFLSAVTDGRKGSQDPTRLLEILYLALWGLSALTIACGSTQGKWSCKQCKRTSKSALLLVVTLYAAAPNPRWDLSFVFITQCAYLVRLHALGSAYSPLH